jgi:MoaA/NifB/PqqE/SkfB family radical SAM enzyme
MRLKRLSDYTSLWQMAGRQAVLLQRLTPHKLWNAAGILLEYLLGRTVLRFRPVVLRLDPTSHCNLRCPTCHPDGNTFGGEMPAPLFERLLARIPFASLLKGSLYLYGEPLFNRRLPAMISAVDARGVPTSISTNFNVFSARKAEEIIDARLAWIIICVDGADQATYEKYRVGGRLDRVLENIRILVEAKRRRGTTWPIIEVQCIRFAHNAHQLDDIRRLCVELGVERFTTKRDVLAQMNIDVAALPGGAGTAAVPDAAAVAPAVPARPPRRCMYLYGTLHVDYDGSVLPCCVGRSVFGNLSDNTFEEIWNNAKFVAARRFFASGFRDRDHGLDIPCYTCPLYFPQAGTTAERVARVKPG